MNLLANLSNSALRGKFIWSSLTSKFGKKDLKIDIRLKNKKKLINTGAKLER